MLNKLVGEDSKEIIKNSSMIGTMIERNILKNMNTVSPSREPNMTLPLLTIINVGNVKVPEINQALRTRELSLKGLEKELLTRLVVAVQ